MNSGMELVVDNNFGIKLYEKLPTLWEKANTHAGKWLSHSEKILEKISAKI